MVGSSELSPCDDSMTVTTEFRDPTAFDGYGPSFRVYSANTFHIIVSITDAEDIKLCIADIRSIICTECLLDFRIPCRYIYVFIPVNFSSFLFVLYKELYLVSARSLPSFVPRGLLANSVALLAARVVSNSVTAG